MWSNLEQIAWQLLPQLNVKQFKKKNLPLLPQYWHENWQKFRANHLIAAVTNISTKLWSNIENRTWQVLIPILVQIVKQFIINNLATAPTRLALKLKQFRMNYLPLLPQYWQKNVKQFRANQLVAADTNIDTKLCGKNLNRPAVATNTILYCFNSVATTPTTVHVYSVLRINYVSVLKHYYCTVMYCYRENYSTLLPH